MGLWDKVKETAQKAAEAAKDQVQREDSILNKTVEGAKKAADKAVILGKDQVNRQDSGLNKAKASMAKASDGVLGSIDAMDSNNRNDEIASAKRYAAKRKAETMAYDEKPPEETEARERDTARFPNSMEWGDDEVYKKVSETIYPDFRTLPANDKKWAVCEIARYDKKISHQLRAIGSGYIDTFRELADGDEGYQVALDACGLADDRELKRAYQNWLDDSYDDKFYEDDDGGHVKAVRLIGSLVFLRIGGAPGEEGGVALQHAFEDAGVKDVHKLAKLVARTRILIDARDAVIEKTFRPRRASFVSQFLVLKGINADPHFTWVEPPEPGDDGDGSGSGGDGDDFSGGSLMEL
jgi:hypothetical protein